MRIIAIAALLALLVPSPAPAQTTTLPTFAQYPAIETLRGRVAAPDFATLPEVQRFSGYFGRGGAPNFAGAYRIVTWPCGTQCVNVVVMDLRTGRLVRAPEAYNGLAYRRDSRLLIINPPERLPAGLREDEIPAEIRPEFLVFENGYFQRVDSGSYGWNPNLPEPRLPGRPPPRPWADRAPEAEPPETQRVPPEPMARDTPLIPGAVESAPLPFPGAPRPLR